MLTLTHDSIDRDTHPVALNDHKIRFILDYAAGKDVLDLGCVHHDPEAYQSEYWVHRALHRYARSVIGLDIVAPGIPYLQKLGYDVRYGDAQDFDLSETFDVIVAGDIIEHLDNVSGFLESCKRHLRPGGALLLSTPNPWHWKFIIQAVLKKEVPNNPEHTCWFCPRTMRQLLARHGMGLSDIRFGSRYWRDRLVPLPRGVKHTSWHGAAGVV